MDRDALQERVLALFVDELDVALEDLNREVVRLDAVLGSSEGLERTRELFRIAHSVKGAAHAAGVHEAVELAHELEERFGALRDGSRVIDTALIDELLGGLDELARVRTTIAPLPHRAVPIGSAPRTAVRVAVDKLDAVMDRAADLASAAGHWAPSTLGVTNEAHLGARLGRSGTHARVRALSRCVTEVAEAATALSLQPFLEVCEGIERAAHDLAVREGKKVRIVVVGGEVEIDRSVVRALREPLLHLVRNAVDHGIEVPGTRLAAGKPEAGLISVSASLQEGRLVVTVEDDGGGLDRTAVREAAARRGLALSGEETDIVFEAGVTTARLTNVSGRGVGLDAVRAIVERLGGTVTLDAPPRGGAVVTLVAPISLALVRALVVDAGGERLCLPLVSIHRIHRLRPTEVREVDGVPTAVVDGVPLRLTPLAAAAQLTTEPKPSSTPILAVIPDVPSEQVALVVDRLHGEANVVMKPLPSRLAASATILGTTMLAGGEPALVLNLAACVAHGRSHARWFTPPDSSTQASPTPSRVLVVDDTLTTRTLEAGILEAAGYEVLSASDGAEAWEVLEQHGADLVVTDVHMPVMDGYELCERIRASERFAALPVVMMTSLGTDDDRRRGLEAGASAYLVKSDFAQETLLDVIERSL